VPEPEGLSNEFEEHIESVSDFKNRLGEMNNDAADRELFRVLLQGLSESRVGLYSNFHEVAIYKYGYDHEKTKRLAYMCAHASLI
jgi:hypothetical protein